MSAPRLPDWAPELFSAAKAHLAARATLEQVSVYSLTPTDPRFAEVAKTLEALRAAVAKAEGRPSAETGDVERDLAPNGWEARHVAG